MTVGLPMDELMQLADLVRKRNAICAEITRIVGRPALIGHVGEYIAARIFGIELERSATNMGFDGRFREGALIGKSVNVKWYGKKEGLLDMRADAVPDYYLVLTGPSSKVLHSRGEARPWLIEFAYLFDAPILIDCLTCKPVKLGEATSVSRDLWDAAELFPNAKAPSLSLTPDQYRLLALFSSQACMETLL